MRGGAVAATVLSQQQGSRFESWLGSHKTTFNMVVYSGTSAPTLISEKHYTTCPCRHTSTLLTSISTFSKEECRECDHISPLNCSLFICHIFISICVISLFQSESFDTFRTCLDTQKSCYVIAEREIMPEF